MSTNANNINVAYLALLAVALLFSGVTGIGAIIAWFRRATGEATIATLKDLTDAQAKKIQFLENTVVDSKEKNQNLQGRVDTLSGLVTQTKSIESLDMNMAKRHELQMSETRNGFKSIVDTLERLPAFCPYDPRVGTAPRPRRRTPPKQETQPAS